MPTNTCAAPQCPRRRRYHGLCDCHAQRWDKCGRPDMNEWLKAGAPTPTRYRGEVVRRPIGVPFGSKAEVKHG